ncbi:MAG: DNA cytosine methyltransferase, partial [bacterium]
MSKHRFPYKWNLSDGYPAKNGLKVFGTFICGGGSTMGYKLAGFEHLGGVEIDPEVADVYKTNHNPKYLFVEDIRGFADRKEFPEDLYDLDILDGSPPCSSFSMAGNREKDWGKTKVFREGQAEQRLDDLFFDYIRLAKKLQPKVVIAENVKGLIQGNAKAYVHRIKKEFEAAGYKVQLF